MRRSCGVWAFCSMRLSCASAQAEAAWRSRHKWAAQRLAHLLGDAHAQPPLGPVLDAVERVSMSIGLAVNGAGVGSGPSVWAWQRPRRAQPCSWAAPSSCTSRMWLCWRLLPPAER